MIFVALEGIDNCGKTTLSAKLYDDLKKENIKVFITRELIETDVGKIVLESFQNKEKLSPKLKALYFAADRQIRYEKIIKEDYDVVIWDRYVYSSFVYREMEACNVEWVKKLNNIYRVPELNIYMDIDIDEAMKRALENKRVLPYTKEELMKCKDIYKTYVDSDDLIYHQGDAWLLKKILKAVEK